MIETWDSRIQRAERLASERPDSNELLEFYAVLLRSQKEIYEYLRTRKGWLPCGKLARDLPVLCQAFPNLLRTVETHGPDELATQARDLLKASYGELGDELLEYWREPSDLRFFAKAFLQSYASW